MAAEPELLPKGHDGVYLKAAPYCYLPQGHQDEVREPLPRLRRAEGHHSRSAAVNN
jgi:hypothetical protein